MQNAPKLKVAIVGSGLAGMSTAVELLDQGYEVDIYEQRPFIGGKVASYRDRDGNHVEMGYAAKHSTPIASEHHVCDLARRCMLPVSVCTCPAQYKLALIIDSQDSCGWRVCSIDDCAEIIVNAV